MERSTAAPARYSDEELRRILIERAHRFDLQPLMEVLERYGYRREDILLESNMQQKATSTLVAGIRFDGPSGRPIITLNLGLLGANGLLPSYFEALIEANGSGERYRDFIRFFDHWLLTNILRVSFPEQDPTLYPNWDASKRDMLHMMGVRSVTTLSWLFQLTYPELPVRVTAAQIPELDKSSVAAAGKRLDGSGVLGGAYQASAAGFAVTLVAEDERDERGRMWLDIIRQRFEQVLQPVLSGHAVQLHIELLILEYERWVDTTLLARLPSSRMGLERIKPKEEQPYRLNVFSGTTGAVLAAE